MEQNPKTEIDWDVNLFDSRNGTKIWHHAIIFAVTEEEAKTKAARKYPECTIVSAFRRTP